MNSFRDPSRAPPGIFTARGRLATTSTAEMVATSFWNFLNQKIDKAPTEKR
jgi:hypothetical protein